MNTFTLILVCLFLGYYTGRKQKKRKWKKYENDVEEEKIKLMKEIEELKHKNRLSMYRADYKHKYDADYFEQELVRYTSLANNMEKCLAFFSLIDFMRSNGNEDQLSYDILFNINTFETSVYDLKQTLKHISGVPNIKVNYNHLSIDRDLNNCIELSNCFIKDIHLEQYTLTYQRLYESFNRVIEVMDEES